MDSTAPHRNLFQQTDEVPQMAASPSPPPAAARPSLPESFASRFAFVDVPGVTAPRPRATRSQTLDFPRHLKATRSTRSQTASDKPVRTQASHREPLAETQQGSAPPSPSSTPQPKRKKPRRAYDDPSPALTSYPPSAYPPVIDHLKPSDPNRRLDLLVCGLNPGLRSSQSGTHFAHPSNHFYKTLVNSALTPIRVSPADCAKLVDQERPLPSIGLTNICIRPTAEGGELGRRDYQIGTPVLARKIRSVAKPRAVVFTGKGIGVEWERCCRELGALRAKRRSAQREEVKSEEEKAPEDLREGAIYLPFPTGVPWAIDEPLGLGLLPFVIRSELPENPSAANFEVQGSRSLVHIKDEEEKAPFSVTMPKEEEDDSVPTTSEHARYSFFFLTTSPSGRVTTMGIAEKSEWMRRCKDCVDFLASGAAVSEEHKQGAKVEDAADGSAVQSLVSRRFEVIDCTKFEEG
ncbi:hypothetical protein BCV69DRAFT_87986 [Microstroma glucosiphilum]|uniref:Uracil-DNA glycosylase-like domain-containing protein n=1 Tax=Pseudomicrostroma glucosiphilum TaxID=1684307 RepID=A0A316TXM2_9BASI|nr:hypothetical protein BCV69DRAFT_87986 [Pseudomicrostroma glucosiphilum]PWN17900.1 hypothetical protein BCV69DRAFT_87986 [Pseudomicrostroma glucosiphilum]